MTGHTVWLHRVPRNGTLADGPRGGQCVLGSLLEVRIFISLMFWRRGAPGGVLLTSSRPSWRSGGASGGGSCRRCRFIPS